MDNQSFASFTGQLNNEALCTSRMRHRKLHILGGPGAGKTYVSKKLSKEYGYPVFDLDEFFWDKTKKRLC